MGRVPLTKLPMLPWGKWKLWSQALRKNTGSFSETHPYVCILGCGHLTAHAVPLSLLSGERRALSVQWQ